MSTDKRNAFALSVQNRTQEPRARNFNRHHSDCAGIAVTAKSGFRGWLMFGEFSKRDVVIAVITLIVATALTIEGTYYVLRSYVMSRPDPLYQQGGLKPNQVAK
jgi:hypothetical protein